MSLSMLIHNAEDLTGDLPLLRSRGKGLQLSAIGSRHVAASPMLSRCGNYLMLNSGSFPSHLCGEGTAILYDRRATMSFLY